MRRYFRPVHMLTLPTLLLLGACHPKPPPEQKTEYTGPILPLADVVARVNANNARVPTLYAAHRFGARIVDEKGDAHEGGGDGVLMYRRPGDLKMTGQAPGTDVFDLGCNAEVYWLTLFLKADTMWYGRLDRLDAGAARALPVRPDLVVEVLALGLIDTDFRKFPSPVMRFEGIDDLYVLTWVLPTPDRLVAQREVSYDRQTLHPRRVRLYDETGRVVLRAELSDHRPMEVPGGVPQAQWPVIARKYELFFPLKGSTMTVELDDVSLEYRGLPKDISFQRPEDPGVSKTVNLDEPQANR